MKRRRFSTQDVIEDIEDMSDNEEWEMSRDYDDYDLSEVSSEGSDGEDNLPTTTTTTADATAGPSNDGDATQETSPPRADATPLQLPDLSTGWDRIHRPTPDISQEYNDENAGLVTFPTGLNENSKPLDFLLLFLGECVFAFTSKSIRI